jgi:hypothetical protein
LGSIHELNEPRSACRRARLSDACLHQGAVPTRRPRAAAERDPLLQRQHRGHGPLRSVLQRGRQAPGGRALQGHQEEGGSEGGGGGAAWRSTLWSVVGTVKWHGAGVVLIYGVTLSIFPGFITEDVDSEALGDWYPILLITACNVFDLVGKALPALYLLQNADVAVAGSFARLLFYPLLSLLRVPAWAMLLPHRDPSHRAHMSSGAHQRVSDLHPHDPRAQGRAHPPLRDGRDSHSAVPCHWLASRLVLGHLTRDQMSAIYINSGKAVYPLCSCEIYCLFHHSSLRHILCCVALQWRSIQMQQFNLHMVKFQQKFCALQRYKGQQKTCFEHERFT